MASETTSSLILFIAALAIAGIAAGAMAEIVGSMATELRDRGNAMADTIATDIAIVNDPDNVPYDGGADELTIYVKNTGTAVLAPNETLILVDGQAATYTTTYLDGATSWRPGVVTEFTVSPVQSPAGDTRVRVSYGTIGDSLEFRV